MTSSLAHIARRPVLRAVLMLAAASVLASTLLASAPEAARSYAYGWPVKPFNHQHPVRGFFGDPRISNHGESRQFHFGVDISAPNGTPVYATITGRIWIHPLHRTTVAIVGSAGVVFSYWHVVPTVRSGDRALAYKTLIGRIEAPYGHVHFSEARNGRYLNPLRPGAMGPFADATWPSVTALRTELEGRPLHPTATREFDLVAEVRDETPLAVPRPWHDLPVTPALVRWRLVDGKGRQVLGWGTAADFRLTIPPASEFGEVWATGTTQNHVRAPGRYRMYLAHTLSVRAGRYFVEVTARDSRGNRTSTRFSLAVD